MPTETNELIAFHSVVKHSSFAKAAEELALSPSGVSRIVTRLEERLGVRLVQRTTRSLSLTEAGAAFYARAGQILADLMDAEAEVQKATTQPRGTLRVSAPIVFGQLYVTPLLEQVLSRYPELHIDLTLTNRFVDLIDEGIDLALRIGSLTDSRLIARRLCSNQRVLVAAPSYLARRGLQPTSRVESDRTRRSAECPHLGSVGHEQRRGLTRRGQARHRHHGRADPNGVPPAALRRAGARAPRVRIRA
jgi:DNA-binding transcriptional LysR family regulator